MVAFRLTDEMAAQVRSLVEALGSVYEELTDTVTDNTRKRLVTKAGKINYPNLGQIKGTMPQAKSLNVLPKEEK